jgi:hypothetical protein
MEYGLLTVHQGDLGPQLLGTVTAAITHVKRNNLAGLGVDGNPDPWLMSLLLHEAPHLIGFGFQPSKHHIGWTGRQLDVSVIGTGRKALDHEVQEPRETDAHSPTDPMQGNALAQQVLNQRASRGRNDVEVHQSC